MTLALARSLVETGWSTRPTLPACTPKLYDHGGVTGDGGSRHAATGRRRRLPWNRAIAVSQGSFGNGGAMRIAPVGLAYRHAGDDELAKAVEDAIICTHVHPEAIDGALVQAKAVATAATANVADLDSDATVQSLRAICRTEVVAAKLDALADSLRHDDDDVYVIGRVGNGIRASQAVAAALWAFLRYGEDYRGVCHSGRGLRR